MGGDHKCPLCEATFTRPQHVGRHLRGHTGDRPYECKECPLRFARSDLLSRHVNKAHKPPEEGEPVEEKKGRRKSLPAVPVEPSEQESEISRARRASFGNPQPHLQAQSMYPHHPLLAGAPGEGWSSNGNAGINGITPPSYSNAFTSTALPGAIGNPMYANGFAPQYAVPPMRPGFSDQGYASASMGRGTSVGSLSSMGYEFGFKKRACDHCNHSKVRCDFSDPCLRCAQRNIPCTYNKPQKARSNASGPSTRTSKPMTSTASGSNSSTAGSSVSPQSYLSSPHSMSSPIAATLSPRQQMLQRPVSIPAPLTHHSLDPSLSNPYLAGQDLPWSENLPSGPTMQAVGGNPQWQQSAAAPLPYNPAYDPSQAMLPGYAGSSNVPSQPYDPAIYSRNPQTQPYNPLPIPQRANTSSTSSPQLRLAPTPSLTSHATSPSSSDEPAERRTSQNSNTSGVWQESPMGKPIDLSSSFMPDPKFAVPLTYSPSQMTTNLSLNSSYQQDLSVNSTFAWPGAAEMIDHQFHYRQSLTSDDEDPPRPPSAASTYHDQDEATLRAMQHRRRSSAGLWASAFNQMTLQDGSQIPIFPNVTAFSNPYLPNPMNNPLDQKRPSFPMFPLPETGTATKLPSLSDVKDLWKLFMSDPTSTGHTPGVMGEKLNAFDSIPSGNSPRPGIGPRTLSKSNSMPDLNSPALYGQAFFFTYPSGITPRPGMPQQSYLPNHNPDHESVPAPDDPAMRKWKNEISQRQASFNMMPGSKMGRSPTLVHMLPPNPYGMQGRPMASILQHPSALLQTLAPERTPSFGQPDSQNLPTPHQPTFAKTPSRLSSATARPGNKRLASQTIGPDQQKKGTFTMWDGGDDGTLADAEDEGLYQGQAGVSSINGDWSAGTNSSRMAHPPINAGHGQTMASRLPAHTAPMYHSTWPPISVGPSTAMRAPPVERGGL